MAPQGLKPALKTERLIAALKRCATQKPQSFPEEYGENRAEFRFIVLYLGESPQFGCDRQLADPSATHFIRARDNNSWTDV